MFRKEESFAAFGTRTYKNNNPGNIIATGSCKGLPFGSSCSGFYGEISTNGHFGIYSIMADCVKAFYKLLVREYKPGSERNCEDIPCIISAYCPATECGEEIYTKQIIEWTQQYQCQLVGLQRPIIAAPNNPSLPTISITVVPGTITAEYFKVQIGVFRNIYLSYDPSTWDITRRFPDNKLNNDGEQIQTLKHKVYGCYLQDNLGVGTPESW